MKCPVCPGEIEVKDDEVGDSYPVSIFNYYPECNKCGLTTKESFDTPESALEAMRPVVSDEEVEIIWNLCGEFCREYHSTAKGLNPHGTHFNSEFIKQELEKFYAKR